MSWMSKLYETYEVASRMDVSGEDSLMPICHTPQNAHINIVIDGDGNFKRASVEKKKLILPATEKSAGRASGEAAHPLADKIQYVAADYERYGGKKNAYFQGYKKQLAAWCESPFSHSKACSVLKYVSKECVVSDLVAAGILHTDENDKLLYEWPFEITDEHPLPQIFRVLPKGTGKDKGLTEQGNALVCWTVEEPGVLQSDSWTDRSLQQSWIDYDLSNGGEKGLCFVSGKEQALASNHPAKIRHSGDKAKFVSANDASGFVYRGRFTDKDGVQAVGVGFDVTQKAHSALRWLLSRQGRRIDSQYYVSWAVSGKDIPSPLEDTYSLLSGSVSLTDESAELPAENIDHTVNLGEGFALKFNSFIAGYGKTLEPTEEIVVLGLDSATPGRMSLLYYRELLASEFLERIKNWHIQFAWPQRHSKEIPDSKGKKGKKKEIWPVSAPVPKYIAEAAYGDVLKSSPTLEKNLLQRILPCIVDGRSFPRDIVVSALHRVSNRNGYKQDEGWKWKRDLGISCALYKGYYLRHPDRLKRRNYSMALEKERNSRDYLYGRLLAVAERIEEVALSVAGESRTTTAARLMQRFAERPFSTWRNIELGLTPYMQRLKVNRAGFLVNRKKELDSIVSLFQADDFTSEKPLSGEFLLGYHCQVQDWKNTTTEKEENE